MGTVCFAATATVYGLGSVGYVLPEWGLEVPAVAPYLLLIASSVVFESFRNLLFTPGRRSTEPSVMEAQLRASFQSAPQAAVLVAADESIRWINSAAERLTGWRESEARGRPLQEVVHLSEGGAAAPPAPLSLAVLLSPQANASPPATLLSRDGHQRRVELCTVPLADPQRGDASRPAAMVTLRDVPLATPEPTVAASPAKRFSRISSLQLYRQAQETQRRYEDLVNDLEAVVWEADPDTFVFTFVSQKAEAILGYPVDERWYGEDFWFNLIHPEDREFAKNHCATNIRIYDDFDFEYRAVRADGAVVWLHDYVRVLRHPDGKPRQLRGLMMDVTPRKRLEQELRQQAEATRESEARFRQLAESLPLIVWSARPDGTIDYQNDRWAELTGLPADSLATEWLKFVHPDDIEPADQRWRDSIATGNTFQVEMRFRERGGGYRWYLARALPVFDDEGRIVRWFGTGTDIDAQKRAEETARFLAQASVELGALTDPRIALQNVARLAVPFFGDWCAVDVLNDDATMSRIAVANVDPALVEMLQQYTEYQLNECPTVHDVMRSGRSHLGTHVTQDEVRGLSNEPERQQILLALGIRSYMCVPIVVQGTAWGAIFFVMAESGVQYSPDDLAIAEDIARRAAIAIENMRLYDEVREGDRRKDEFLAMLAHELRNPLAAIRNALTLLSAGDMDQQSLDWVHEMLGRQVEQLVRLVDDLLDVSRIMRGKIELRKEPVELASFVQRAVEMAQPMLDARGHRLIVELPDQPIWLLGDGVRLAQVIANLLNNAAKFTMQPDSIWLHVVMEQEEVVIRVRDRGIGIDRDMLPYIFNLFTQADRGIDRTQGGLGIGLTLVRTLVAMHNGTVTATSAGRDQGSEFTVRLPALPCQCPTSPAVGESTNVGERLRILVVDDNLDALRLLSAMLSKFWNHEVETAADGLEGLRKAQLWQPDVILLDIGLPGMNGFEVARRLRDDPKFDSTLLVAVTGYGQESDRRRSKQAGFDEHLVKPVGLQTLRQVFAHPRIAARRNTATIKAGKTS